MVPEWSKTGKRAALEAASSSSCASIAGILVAGPHPGSAEPPRATRRIPRGRRSRAEAPPSGHFEHAVVPSQQEVDSGPLVPGLSEVGVRLDQRRKGLQRVLQVARPHLLGASPQGGVGSAVAGAVPVLPEQLWRRASDTGALSVGEQPAKSGRDFHRASGIGHWASGIGHWACALRIEFEWPWHTLSAVSANACSFSARSRSVSASSTMAKMAAPRSAPTTTSNVGEEYGGEEESGKPARNSASIRSM